MNNKTNNKVKNIFCVLLICVVSIISACKKPEKILTEDMREQYITGNTVDMQAIKRDGITKIGDEALRYKGTWNEDKRLTGDLILPNTITSIGIWSFAYNAFTSLVIPDSVEYIGARAFDSTLKGVKTIKLPKKITIIENETFRGNSLEEITIPKGVTNIKYGAFANNQLKSISLPMGLLKIGEHAFSGNNLTEVAILKSVTAIADEAFTLNHDLQKVRMAKSLYQSIEPRLDLIFGVLGEKNELGGLMGRNYELEYELY